MQLLIFTEGEKTEPIYLTHWHRLHNERIIVKIDSSHHGQTPRQLVQAAADQRASDLRDARHGHGDAFDEYWCVFDVDEHHMLPEAMELADAREIRIALSNPCVELWFLLHFEDHTAYIERQDAQRRAYQRLRSAKTLNSAALDLLVERYIQARDRAQALDLKHDGDGSPPHSNPSSGVWRLIDVICV